MKWSDIHGNCIVITRKKTETTRKNNIKQIQISYTFKLREIFNKIGNTNSQFILGKLQEGYSEEMFKNKCRKLQKVLNKNLSILSEKLNLSVPLKLESARDCYATSLLRKKISKDSIGEMLGHSSSVVTEHYFGAFIQEEIFEINDALL